MCTSLKSNRTFITPGMMMQYRTLSAIKNGRFGLSSGQMPNVREDKLQTYWTPFFNNRGIIEVDVFYEKKCSFGVKDGVILVPCIYDMEDNVGIITTDAVPPVSHVHHRMPCVILDDMAWLRSGIILHMESIIQSKIA